MASDNYDDYFDYNSSQDSSYFDEQIDLFEFRQYFKTQKSKQRIKKARSSVSKKILQNNVFTIKLNCANDEVTPKAEQKIFRYDRKVIQHKRFECDVRFNIEEDTPKTKTVSTGKHLSKKCQSPVSQTIDNEPSKDFSEFRQNFYKAMHKVMKSSCAGFANQTIVNIRPAPIHECVQQQFMQRLSHNPDYFPELVYHGTQMDNISSILRYGLLVPNQPHSTNPEAPQIRSVHGQAFGRGIYSSSDANMSLSYASRSTNTIFACAALPPRQKRGKVCARHGNILVLTAESQIIPLFFIDYHYTSICDRNRPHFILPQDSVDDQDEEQREIIRRRSVSRKYLRKMLDLINNDRRRNHCYQQRVDEIH